MASISTDAREVAKVSGTVDRTVVPSRRSRSEEIEIAKAQATQRCMQAGAAASEIEVIEIDVVPMSYVDNGAYRLVVRVVGDLDNEAPDDEVVDELEDLEDDVQTDELRSTNISADLQRPDTIPKALSYEVTEAVDIRKYKPKMEGDFWYISDLDLAFLNDGTGVLGVGSTGEPYASYLACLMKLRAGEDIIIRRQDTFPDEGVVLSSGFMVT